MGYSLAEKRGRYGREASVARAIVTRHGREDSVTREKGNERCAAIITADSLGFL